jgi:hypothetical protein
MALTPFQIDLLNTMNPAAMDVKLGDLLAAIEAGEVTIPITPATGEDLVLQGVTGKDIKLKLTDAAGSRKVEILDSSDNVVMSIDSDGNIIGTLLTGNVTGNVTGDINGKCRTIYAHTDTDGAPSNAECISAFGAAATVGAGFIGIYKDDHASGKTYVCVSNGTAYDVAELTAAVTE